MPNRSSSSIVIAACASLIASNALAVTELTLQASLDTVVLNGIPNPLPALPSTARITLVYDEALPADNTIGNEAGEPSGRIYDAALHSLTFEYFDVFGFLIGESTTSNGRIVTRDNFLDATDGFSVRSEDISGPLPFDRMGLSFTGGTDVFTNLEIDLDQFSATTFAAFDEASASISTFAGGPLDFLRFDVDLTSFTFEQEATPTPVPLPAGLPLLASALAVIGWLRSLRRDPISNTQEMLS
ncbi:MAG: VPLPA-CTERM sorting domain-containing protein [Pseudomonadota bacterium]